METEKQENGKTEPNIEIEKEKQETTAIVPAPPAIPPELLSLGREPEAILAEAHKAAKALMNVVESKQKPVIINNELYLEFEDWQVLGRFFGLTSGVESTEYVEFGAKKDKKFGFKAGANLMSVSTGQIISRAEAMCLTDEPKWRHKPLFQISSMAQTRAQAKAFRNTLSFVVVLAGYKPTPAEELDNGLPAAVVQMPQPKPKNGGEVVAEAIRRAYQPAADPNNLVPALKASIQDAQKKKRVAKDANSVRLKSCRTMQELKDAWLALTKEERKALASIKDERRAELEAIVCQ